MHDYLHSNMDRLKQDREVLIFAKNTNLHSNMDRLKPPQDLSQ